MSKKLLACVVGCLLLSGVLYAQQLKSVLTYLPEYGVYTTSLNLSSHQKPIEMIVDTGSANFLVRGDNKVCPGCHSFITKDALAVDKADLSKNINKVRYGSAQMSFRSYKDQLQVLNASPIRFEFAVATSGKHVSNIWGLAYQVLAMPHNNPLPTLFDSMRDQLNLADQFSLLLCADRGKSYLSFSKEAREIKTTLKTPIVDKFFYSVNLTGIKSGDKSIIQFKQGQYQTAILDSGTGGMILLPEQDRSSVINYIYKNTSKKNQSLPKQFWQKNDCLLKSDVDIQHLPTLQFGFVSADNPKQSIYLNLPPERYISSGGCKKGAVRLAFVENLLLKKHYKAHPHKQALFHRMPGVIIGTPLFEQYEVVFNRSKPALIGFFPSKGLCKP